MKYILLLITFILAISCDKGLEPPPEPPTPGYLKGKIYFENEWPPEDSLFGLRLAAFRTLPDSNSNLAKEVIDGNIYINDLEQFVDSTEFLIKIDKIPDTLRYITIAYQYESTFTSQYAVGIFTETGNKDEPGTVIVNSNDTVNIKIEVDWDDYPPQPF